MKRKKKAVKPCWQTIPMGKVEALIRGWERLKHLREEISDQPEALAHLRTSIEQHPAGNAALVGKLEVIIPAASAAVSAWLENHPRALPRDPVRPDEDPAAAVVMLWESFRALGTLAPDGETRLRWLAERTREERHLLTRLSNRLSLSLS